MIDEFVPLTTEQKAWQSLLNKFNVVYREDLSRLNKFMALDTAEGWWLDMLGAFFELPRPVDDIYLDTDTLEKKTKKDNFYRTFIRLKINSLHDDFNFSVFSGVADAFMVSGRLIVNIFETYIQFNFFNLTDADIVFINENKLLLRSFKAGRSGYNITVGKVETFLLDGQFGKRLGYELYKE